MSAIAVDAGTSLIKAVVFDESGREVAVARHATEVRRPHPGWAEQDMTAVWRAVVAAVNEVLPSAPDDVRFLALTAQGDGCWLVDDRGEPTGPAVLWSDGRAAPQVDAWLRDGVVESAFRINGSVGFAGLPHAVLTWLRAHDPERLATSATALTCGGWLFFRLTGVVGVDHSDASVPLLDLVPGRTRRSCCRCSTSNGRSVCCPPSSTAPTDRPPHRTRGGRARASRGDPGGARPLRHGRHRVGPAPPRPGRRAPSSARRCARDVVQPEVDTRLPGRIDPRARLGFRPAAGLPDARGHRSARLGDRTARSAAPERAQRTGRTGSARSGWVDFPALSLPRRGTRPLPRHQGQGDVLGIEPRTRPRRRGQSRPRRAHHGDPGLCAGRGRRRHGTAAVWRRPNSSLWCGSSPMSSGFPWCVPPTPKRGRRARSSSASSPPASSRTSRTAARRYVHTERTYDPDPGACSAITRSTRGSSTFGGSPHEAGTATRPSDEAGETGRPAWHPVRTTRSAPPCGSVSTSAPRASARRRRPRPERTVASGRTP